MRNREVEVDGYVIDMKKLGKDREKPIKIAIRVTWGSDESVLGLCQC